MSSRNSFGPRARRAATLLGVSLGLIVLALLVSIGVLETKLQNRNLTINATSSIEKRKNDSITKLNTVLDSAKKKRERDSSEVVSLKAALEAQKDQTKHAMEVSSKCASHRGPHSTVCIKVAK